MGLEFISDYKSDPLRHAVSTSSSEGNWAVITSNINNYINSQLKCVYFFI